MPHKPHPCAFPGCDKLVARKEAIHCRKHAIKTPEHIAKIAAANRGKKLTTETRRRISMSRTGPGETNRTCEHCGGIFTVEKPSRPRRFCSRACGYANRQGDRAPNWRDDMPILNCRLCGRQFRVSAIGVRRFTCSARCKAIWQKKHQPTKQTNIEQIMEAALIDRGWHYVPQHPLCGVTIADFYLPEMNTAIFCDGDYWHSLPGKPERDQRQTKILEENGYIVHRFSGTAILADIDQCLSAIKHL